MNKKIDELTPKEFEKWCFEILKGIAEKDKLEGLNIVHNEKIEASDGTYQIDVYAEFFAFGTKMKILCECKKHKNKIPRKVVAELFGKLDSTGSNKGIIISTSDYQKGAVQYAEAHGVALIRVRDYNLDYISHSSGGESINEEDPFLCAEKKMPPYEAFDCISGEKVYPTKTLISDIYKELNDLIKEKMGIDIDLMNELEDKKK